MELIPCGDVCRSSHRLNAPRKPVNPRHRVKLSKVVRFPERVQRPIAHNLGVMNVWATIRLLAFENGTTGPIC